MYGSGAVSWTQMMSNKGIKIENSYIHIFEIQTEPNVHPLISSIFSIARWSIYFCGVPVNHSPLHARTQQYALLRNKNKTKQKKYPWKLSQHRDKNAEQIFFRFQLNFMIKPEYSFKQTQF